jgi:hypothetical protein
MNSVHEKCSGVEMVASEGYEQETGLETVVLGDHERISLPLGNFVRLAQVRGRPNKEQPRLVESIRARGLLNQINVIRMDTSTLEEYIELVNGIWHGDASLDQYEHQRHADGNFYVIFGGHSRIEAVNTLQEQNDTTNYVIVANVHHADSLDEVMTLQVEDNIHSAPSKEEEAVMIVEMFEYGRREKWWNGKAGFRRTMDEKNGKKIGRRVLDDALDFAELPLEARQAVFSKIIPYSAGVQLGRDSETIKAYAHIKPELFGIQPGSQDEPSEEAFAGMSRGDRDYRAAVLFLVNSIYTKKLNGPAALRFIEGQINLMKGALCPPEKPAATQTQMFMQSPEEQGRQRLEGLKKKIKGAEADAKYFSIHAVRELIQLNSLLDGETDFSELQEEYNRRLRLFGGIAVSGLEVTAAAAD